MVLSFRWPALAPQKTQMKSQQPLEDKRTILKEIDFSIFRVSVAKSVTISGRESETPHFLCFCYFRREGEEEEETRGQKKVSYRICYPVIENWAIF